jgi:DNA (cytosine-5)-methyltransferase 1
VERQAEVKPTYRIPSMQEIERLPGNGFVAASTFSGAGGSCLGYRMAGFDVRWANEFIPAAADTYRLNHPGAILDTRDVREVKGSDILKSIGIGVGDLDLFDGSPPCASFSHIGIKEKGWKREKQYSDTTQRVDDLFFEYCRLVGEVLPKVFVAENVAGLARGISKGYFLRILKTLRGLGYQVEARILDAQWLGIPQRRPRLIFIGVRDDLGLQPAFPSPFPFKYTVADALPHIVKVKHGPDWRGSDRPAGTIVQSGLRTSLQGTFSSDWVVDRDQNVRRWTIDEVRVLQGFPADFQLTGNQGRQWERMGRAVPPPMMCQIAGTIRDEVLARTKR